MIKWSKVEGRAVYGVARIEGWQVVRVRQFPHPRKTIRSSRLLPAARRMGRQFRLRGTAYALRRLWRAAAHAVAPRSYQPRDAFTILTTDSITGTSISTPTTVARAAPD
jgi:hypothetical protein